MKLTKYENEVLNKLKYLHQLSIKESISLIDNIDTSLINSSIQAYVSYVRDTTLDLKNLEYIALTLKNSEEVDYEIVFKSVIFIESIINKHSGTYVTRKHVMNIIPKKNPIIEYALHLKESIVECFIVN